MKKQLIIILFTFFLTKMVSAQSNQFRIGLGLQRTWMLDKQASPLKYKANDKTISLGYTNTGSKGKFNVELNGALGDFFPADFRNRQMYTEEYSSGGTIMKDSGLLTGMLYHARIKMGYVTQISNGYSKINNREWHNNTYAGASISNQLFYSDNIVRNGWMNSTSLNAEFEHVANYNRKHFFSIKASIPIFARNTRLPYHNTISSPDGGSNVKTLFKQGSSFAWLANFQNIQIDAGYDYAISNKFSLGIHYFGQWLHYNEEKPITLYQNNIGVNAKIY